MDVDKRDSSGGQDVDARVTLVQFGDLGLCVVLVVRVAGQGDGMAVLRRDLEGRGIDDGQDGDSQGDNEGSDLHLEEVVDGGVGWVEGEDERMRGLVRR